MYALVASGFTLVLGVIKIFNFALGYFYMLGAYVTFAVVTALGYPYPIAVVAAMVAAAILGVLFQFAVVQRVLPHGFFHTLLVTILFGTIISQSSFLTFGYKQGVIPAVVPGTLNIGEVVVSPGKLVVIAGAIVVMVALYYFMKTKMGTAMLAAAENRDVAGLQGINVNRIFWVTTAVGCGLCGVAGGFVLPILSASLTMGTNVFLRALLVVIIGGMGSMSGALIAAFLVGLVESFAYQFMGHLNMIIIFVFMAILLYFRPGGLLGRPLPIPGE